MPFDLANESVDDGTGGTEKVEVAGGPVDDPVGDQGGSAAQSELVLAAELATLGWVHWYHTARIHSRLNDLSPDQLEAAYTEPTTEQNKTENHNIQPAQYPV